MGRGIALAALTSGFRVVLYELQSKTLHQATEYIGEQLRKSIAKGRISHDEAKNALGRLCATEKIADAVGCEIIIEAIIEDIAAKEDLFQEIEESGISETVILATNTSSLPVSLLGAKRKSPQRFIGLHFFNPANIMKLVEVVRGARTDEETTQHAAEFARALGKTPAIVRDVPGFIVNRTARNYYNEAMRIAVEGAAQPEQIDRIMKAAGFKMGPFELMDLIGNDVNLEVTKSVWEQYFKEPRFAPSIMQQEAVDAGNYGRKTGRGFYQYSPDGQ
jgi:3-hydroxybutyryl-CoA dehydrogenase